MNSIDPVRMHADNLPPHPPLCSAQADMRLRQPWGGAAQGADSPVSFIRNPRASHVDFSGRSNDPHAHTCCPGGKAQSEPLAQFIALIVDFIKRLQAIMSDAGTSQTDSFGETGRRQASCNERAPTQDPTQESVRPGTNRTGGGGNVPSASPVLGHQLSVQKSPQDVIAMANDPERGEVIKVGFNKGHYTQNSTSPRAEIKSETLLQEGQPYRFTFGMKREADNDGTFFQVLDHNNAKPSPRAWMATKDGQYQLHLKTSDASNAPSKVFNIGQPGDASKDVGKWTDFQIDFKRDIDDGSISVTKNGQDIFDKSGISTMFDTRSDNAYAKFGQYRNEGDRTPAVSYFSGFNIASPLRQ